MKRYTDKELDEMHGYLMRNSGDGSRQKANLIKIELQQRQMDLMNSILERLPEKPLITIREVHSDRFADLDVNDAE
jgi:hypothetical protein